MNMKKMLCGGQPCWYTDNVLERGIAHMILNISLST